MSSNNVCVKNAGAYTYGFQGQERDDEVSGSGNSYTAEYWQYDSRLGRRWNVDPVVKPHESSYAAFGNNPIWFVDRDGRDTNKINSDGSQTVIKDKLSTQNYQYTTGAGVTHDLGTFNVNKNGLIKLNDYEYSSGEINIGFDVKTPKNSYVDPAALGSLLGALIENNVSDLTITGVSTSNGSSPSPSRSHVQGKVFDLRYLRNDRSGGSANLGEGVVDLNRQNAFNSSLAKYGFTKMLSEHYTWQPLNTSGGQYSGFNTLVTHKLVETSHYTKSRHHHHLHVGGKWGGVIQYSPTLHERPAKMSKMKSRGSANF